MVSASILVFSQRGAGGTPEWFRNMLNSNWRGNPHRYLTAFLFIPVVCLVEFAVLRRSASSVPASQIVISEALFLFAAYLVAAVGEEVGWQGYALSRSPESLFPLEQLRHNYGAGGGNRTHTPCGTGF